MGLDGLGFCSASISSAAALVTASDDDKLGEFFWAGNSSVVLDTQSYVFLGM